MVSTRPSPTPHHGRIPYPTADTLTPGDVGQPPQQAVSAAALVSWRRGSSAGEGSSTQPGATPTGLQRLRSMRDRVRDHSRDRNQQAGTTPGRNRADSVAVGMLATTTSRERSDKDREKDKDFDREKSTQGLRNWWKAFSQNRSSTPSPPPYQPGFRLSNTTTTMNTRRVFGVPLARVLTYASMKISTSAPDGSLYVWGEVPIIVGRCGAYLKGKADIEGLFRISGSAKRMRDLQTIFDEGPTYGSDVDWANSPFTPHDAATMFRRYLTQMPESVIPHAFYDQFRAVQVAEHVSIEMKLRDYKRLIRALPTENRFLLLYTLDLLGIVDKQSDKNLMNAANLALIFQPCLLNHPGHEMRPSESALSKDVVELLITHQHHFVMSMAMKLSKKRHHHGHARAGETASPKPAPPEVSNPAEPTATQVTLPEGTQTRIVIPAAIPEHTQPEPALSSPSMESSAPSTNPVSIPSDRPKAVRANTDYLQPSDSDDEPPPGGYYIVESSKLRSASPLPRIASPLPPALEPPLSPPQSPTSSGVKSSPSLQVKSPASPAFSSPFTAQDLARPKQRSTKRGRPTLPNVPSQGGVPAIGLMDPSDSDDDAPPGGYMVYENKRTASGGSPTPVTSPSGAKSLSRSHTAQARPMRSTEGHTSSPKRGGGDSVPGLLRHKTLPTKRVSEFTSRIRRTARDV